MRVLASVVVLFLCACSSSGAEPPAEQRAPAASSADLAPRAEQAPPAEPEREVAPTGPVPTSPPPRDGAMRAYQDALAALARRDAAAYSAAFAPTLACFHGRRDVSSEEALVRRVAAMRAGDEVATTLHPLELRVVRESEDEVELVDFGWTGDGAHRTGTVFHRKRVVLRSVEGRWLVTVEAPLDERRCELPPLDQEPPPLWTELRRQYATLVDNCEPPGSEDDESYPGIGGSIGCDPSSWSIDARRFCPAGPERSGCVAKARREIEAFGFEAEAHDDEDR